MLTITEELSPAMVTVAFPEALTPASGHMGVSFAVVMGTLKTVGWGPVLLSSLQATDSATRRNTGIRALFIAIDRLPDDSRGCLDLIRATRGLRTVAKGRPSVDFRALRIQRVMPAAGQA